MSTPSSNNGRNRAVRKSRKSKQIICIGTSNTVNVMLLHRRANLLGAPLVEAGPVAGLHVEWRCDFPDMDAWKRWAFARARPLGHCIIHCWSAYRNVVRSARTYVVEPGRVGFDELCFTLPILGTRADVIALPEPECFAEGRALDELARELLAVTFGDGAVYRQTGPAGAKYCGRIHPMR